MPNTIVLVVLDESGSMMGMDGVKRDGVIDGYNKFIEDQCKVDGNDLCAVIRFGSKVDVSPVMQLKCTPRLDKENYKPNGNTALYDAVCTAIGVSADYKELAPQFVILTDGNENCSMKFTETEMIELIAQSKKER